MIEDTFGPLAGLVTVVVALFLVLLAILWLMLPLAVL